MSPTMNDVLQAALSLPLDQRNELIDALICADTEHETGGLHPDWIAELRRRSADIDAGTAEYISWDEVRAESRKRLGLDG